MLHARTAPTGCCDISCKAARHIACSAAALSYISSVFGRPSGTASASNCFNHHKGTNNISKQNIFVAIFLQIVIFLPQKLLLCNIHCINNRRLTPARRNNKRPGRHARRHRHNAGHSMPKRRHTRTFLGKNHYLCKMQYATPRRLPHRRQTLYINVKPKQNQ